MLHKAKAGFQKVFRDEHPDFIAVEALLEQISKTQGISFDPDLDAMLNSNLVSETSAIKALREGEEVLGEDHVLLLQLKIATLNNIGTGSSQQVLDLTILELKDYVKQYGTSHQKSVQVLGTLAKLNNIGSSLSELDFLKPCIYWTIAGNNPEVLELVLKAGADQSFQDIKTNMSPLAFAISEKSKSSIEILLKHGSNPNEIGSLKLSPLDMAVRAAGPEVVRLLLDAGADTDRLDHKGRSPLGRACILQHEEVVKALLACGVATHHCKIEFQAIHWAIVKENRAITLLLLDSNADIEARAYGRTPLHTAIRQNHPELAELLISRGADVESSLPGGVSCLHNACSQGRKEIAELLLQNGANLNHCTDEGWGIIHTAADSGSIDMLKILLDLGLDSKMRTKSERRLSILAIAAMKGHVNLVEWILKQGADPDEELGMGFTALHYAASNGKGPCARSLLAAGGNPNIRSDKGSTPLFLALQEDHHACAETLAEHGASIPSAEDANRLLQRSVLRQWPETAAWLLNNGQVTVNQKFASSRALLHFAIFLGHTDIFNLLIDNGADINSVDTENCSPFHYAAAYKYPAMIKSLLSKACRHDAVDCYGRKAIDWATDSKECLEAFGIDKDPATLKPTLNEVQIWRSITRFISQTKTSKPKRPGLFNIVARCLALLGNIHDAQIALEQRIDTDKTRSTARHTYHCMLCSEPHEAIKGTLYLCKTCTLFSVCESCFEKNDAKPSHRICSHQNFFRVPRVCWSDLRGEVVDVSGLKLDEWLDKLETKYSDLLEDARGDANGP